MTSKSDSPPADVSTATYLSATTLENLSQARYKISVTPLMMRANAVVSLGQYLFVGLVNIGLHVFK